VNALTNVVGTCARTDVHVVEETLTGGELLLLTTDGVHGVMDDRRIRELLTEHEDPEVAAARIVAAARARGSQDNCTAGVPRGASAYPSRPEARAVKPIRWPPRRAWCVRKSISMSPMRHVSRPDGRPPARRRTARTRASTSAMLNGLVM